MRLQTRWCSVRPAAGPPSRRLRRCSPWPARPGPADPRSPARRSLGWHPDATVDTHRLAVHVRVADALEHHAGQLLGDPEPLREQHALAELCLERLGLLAV